MSASADITVVMRACDRPACFLLRALRSVTAQTARPDLVVLADRGCPATLLEQARHLLDLSGVPLLVVAGGRGPCLGAPLNRALAEVRTGAVAFLDDDDTWHPDALRRLSSTLERAPGAAAAVCRTELVYEVETSAEPREVQRTTFNPGLVSVNAAELAVANRFTLHAALWRTNALRALGGFREDLPVLEDWELNVRAARRYPIEVLPEALARYHRRPPGARASNTPARLHDATVRGLRAEWAAAGLLRLPEGGASRRLHEGLDRLRRLKSRVGERVRWRLRLLRASRP